MDPRTVRRLTGESGPRQDGNQRFWGVPTVSRAREGRLDDRRALTGVGIFVSGFIVVVLAGKVLFPWLSDAISVPNGMYLQGLIGGLLSALLGIGLVLVYRSNRIINFAQGELGAIAATLAAQLHQVYRVPYLISVVTGLAAGLVASLITEFAVIRRFAKAPRLILTVATIGVAQLLSIIELLPNTLNRNLSSQRKTSRFESPFQEFHFTFGGVRFSADHLIVLVVGPLILIGLAYFFTRTRYGVAARAAAENDERARLLGCRVKRVSLIVWGLAGTLSALTAILRAPLFGFQLGAIQGPDLLLRALAAAVLARMESLPTTVVAAILLTMGEQTIFFSFGRTGYSDAFLLGVIVVGLLVQRKRFSRVDPASSSWRSVQEVRPIPRELAVTPEVRWMRWGGRALLAAFVLTLPLYLTPSSTNLASVIMVFAMVGVSLVVLTGWSGNVSLGQWAIVGLGALVTAKVATADPPPDFFIIILIAGLCGAAVSLIIGLPALRIRGLFLGVTTLAFALAGYSWMFQWEILSTDAPILRPFMFGAIDTTSERAYFYVTFVALVAILLLARNLRRSRWGRNLIALRDNEPQAAALGMRPTTLRLGAFAIAGFLAALAGAFYAYNQQSIRSDLFDPGTSVLMFLMVVIGGMGSLTGAVLGAVYLRGIQYFLPAELQLFATGFGVLVLLLVFPGGLGQVFYGLRDRILREIAARKNIDVPSLVADKRRAEPIPDLAEAHALGTAKQQAVERKAKAKVLAETKGSR
jgi:branched-chain amino acid transport system permease protein